jgi:hypothetical protein
MAFRLLLSKCTAVSAHELTFVGTIERPFREHGTRVIEDLRTAKA